LEDRKLRNNQKLLGVQNPFLEKGSAFFSKRKQGTKNKSVKELSFLPQRRLGLLDSKASFRIRDDFEMTDEELLSV
jgi:hypothetical protein